jgi:hypothetical protein
MQASCSGSQEFGSDGRTEADHLTIAVTLTHQQSNRVIDACLYQLSIDIQRLERSGAYLLILDLTNVTYTLFQRSDIFLKCV